MSLFRSENPVLGPYTIFEQLGSSSAALITPNGNLDTSAPVNFRVIDAEPQLMYAGSTAITGSVAAIRGNTTIATQTTLASGYLYGVQGKVTIKGTNSTSNNVTGLLGQLDTSAAVECGTGFLSAIWGDMGATSTDTANTGANIIVLTNTTQTAINSAIYVNAKASYFGDFVEVASAGTWIVAAAVGGSQNKKLKIKLNGTDYFIPCNTA